MSSITEVEITCPKCHQEGNYTVWQSVNVDLNPEMKQKVLDASLFEWVCPHCGETFNVPYSFLYHDMTNNFMIMFEREMPPMLIAESIRIHENNLDEKVVNILEDRYRKDHFKENIIFERLDINGDLEFTVLEMPDKYWEPTEEKHIIPMSEYKANIVESSDAPDEQCQVQPMQPKQNLLSRVIKCVRDKLNI